MHPADLPQWAIDRVVAKHGRPVIFDRLDPARTALVVVDMQEFFTCPGSPLEMPAAREIVLAINRCAEGVRAAGGTVAWVVTELRGGAREWTSFFSVTHPGARGEMVREGLAPGTAMAGLTEGLEPREGDLHAAKDRFSAFLPGASDLPDRLRARGIDTVLIAGTLTNVCCESSARDAMMENFSVVMLADANATRSDEEHLSALAGFAGTFGDVQTVDQALAHLVVPPEADAQGQDSFH
jgi:ureidoacrylate peracid hydrolase